MTCTQDRRFGWQLSLAGQADNCGISEPFLSRAEQARGLVPPIVAAGELGRVCKKSPAA
jgi:hypothetical protein